MRILPVFVGLLGMTGSAMACGPFFTESILWSARAVLASPPSLFTHELGMLELDIELPGLLEVPEVVDIYEAFPPVDFGMQGAAVQLFELSASDLITNAGGCRDTLSLSQSDLARDVVEVAALFQANGTSPTVLAEYRTLRAQMSGELPEGYALSREAVTRWKRQEWPAELPQEFHLYLDGATAYRAKRYDEATDQFTALLNLPLEQRHYRSTWAAYMLARIELKRGDDDLSETYPHFSDVLLAREAGCADSLELCWDALAGLAAFEEKYNDRPEIAMRYYYALARRSHRWSRERFERGPLPIVVDYETTAKDPFLRSLLTMTLTRRLDYQRIDPAYSFELQPEEEEWLGTLERLDLDLTPYEASRLAWIAYDAGSYHIARRWNARTTDKLPLGHWLDAKFAIQDGALDQAETLLTDIAPDLPRARHEPGFVDDTVSEQEIETHLPTFPWADLAVVRMGRDQYVGALEAFMRSGHERDAAYLAEQLLSRNELYSFVNQYWPTAGSAKDNRMAEFIRYLTARRLARDGDFKRARTMLPTPLIPVFDHYVRNYETFRDEDQSDEIRAEAGWEAAQVQRSLGLELFGTSLAPDWFAFGDGWFEGTALADLRLGISSASRIAKETSTFRNPLNDDAKTWKVADYEREFFFDQDAYLANASMEKSFALEPTRMEKWRFSQNASLSNIYRFHYRYVASDLAWEAAKQLPRDHEASAERLNIAGRWIAQRSPNPAKFFYQAILVEHPNTATGRKTKAKNWLPEVEWQFDPWAAAGVERPAYYSAY